MGVAQLISKGKDVSVFFPDVVKNVVCKHHEVRKLVYIFLVRYAEQEPDIALLSINTFQKVTFSSFLFLFFIFATRSSFSSSHPLMMTTGSDRQQPADSCAGSACALQHQD